ncbi:MAG: ATP-binding protein [Gemmatimonadaceae bacterium]
MSDSDDRYRQLFERNTAIQLVADPITGAILDANQAAADFYGHSPAELTRQRFADLSPDPAEFGPGQLEVASLTGAHFAAFPQRHASGEIRLVDVYAGPLSLGDRLVVHMIVHDVTERARMEERERALHAERIARQVNEHALQEWQGTFDAIDLPMLVVDQASRVTRMNEAAAQLTDDAHRKMLGALLPTLGPSPVWSAASDRVRLAQAQGFASATRVSDAAGRTWEVWAARFIPPDATEPRCIVVARELTALLDLQQQVQRRETMARMGELVAGVAHEVRNALFALSSALDAMRARTGDAPEVVRYYPVLTSQVQRLADLTRDLLDFGKPASLTRSACRVDELVRTTVDLARPDAESAGVSITSRFDDADGTIEVDRARLVQVLHNLILNAIQHSPRGGIVHIHVIHDSSEPSPRCRFEVADSGHGFAVQDLPHVFEPFFTRRPGGTGLGLALAHRIITDHGGTIAAANRPGGGAMVTVTLATAHEPLPTHGPQTTI